MSALVENFTGPHLELLAGAEALGREPVQDQAARSELAAKGRGRK